MSVAITADKVVKRYGDLTIIPQLSQNIKNGEFFTLLGPSGCGKTTLLRMIAGFNSIEGGQIRFNDQVINDIPAHKRNIGMVFQSYAIFPHLTVRENVVAAAAFSGRLSRMETRAAVSDVLDAMSLSEKAEIPAGKLSLLDRKRLEIARALATKPQLLLLDEIAAGLTSAEVREVLAIVERLKAQELTILWIEHIIETMLRAADQLICMAEGEVCVSGIPEEVLSSPEVGRLYLGSGSEERKDAGD